jgi:hypothetical protein
LCCASCDYTKVIHKAFSFGIWGYFRVYLEFQVVATRRRFPRIVTTSLLWGRSQADLGSLMVEVDAQVEERLVQYIREGDTGEATKLFKQWHRAHPRLL